MKKQVLMIAIAAVALFTACQQNKGEQAASKSETKTTWTKIEPQDIENPIHLFAERHVAIATGKGDSVNAMSNKLSAAGLTLERTGLGNPTFREANLVIECRKIYAEPFVRERLDSTALSMLSNGTGMHTMFVGEIVNVMERK